VTLVDSAEATADAVSGSMEEVQRTSEGSVVHFVTGDSAAFAHTARVIGGVAGEIRLLPVTELLAYRGDGEATVA
jgi:hypothetical protein